MYKILFFVFSLVCVLSSCVNKSGEVEYMSFDGISFNQSKEDFCKCLTEAGYTVNGLKFEKIQDDNLTHSYMFFSDSSSVTSVSERVEVVFFPGDSMLIGESLEQYVEDRIEFAVQSMINKIESSYNVERVAMDINKLFYDVLSADGKTKIGAIEVTCNDLATADSEFPLGRQFGILIGDVIPVVNVGACYYVYDKEALQNFHLTYFYSNSNAESDSEGEAPVEE